MNAIEKAEEVEHALSPQGEITEIFIIWEVWSGKRGKKHVYLSRKEYDKGLKFHTKNSLRWPGQSLESYSGAVRRFAKIDERRFEGTRGKPSGRTAGGIVPASKPVEQDGERADKQDRA
jgi:hypothetical protein